MDKDATQLELYKHFFGFFLPEGMLDFFDMVWVETKGLDSRESKKEVLYTGTLHMYLDERDNRKWGFRVRKGIIQAPGHRMWGFRVRGVGFQPSGHRKWGFRVRESHFQTSVLIKKGFALLVCLALLFGVVKLAGVACDIVFVETRF